ncbi:hypothetical protein [Ralstonia sp. SET104]|jgi:hypothetical protein|uniref:hypothetical protein n=1 Tax=Ralstonia sp. SET104 TaxID=2448774 RepID=UPI001625F918|nr:hypothetical protein [Ralstonia sp. SET104]
MHVPEIIVTDEADDASIQIIGNGLNHFNDNHVGYGGLERCLATRPVPAESS